MAIEFAAFLHVVNSILDAAKNARDLLAPASRETNAHLEKISQHLDVIAPKDSVNWGPEFKETNKILRGIECQAKLNGDRLHSLVGEVEKLRTSTEAFFADERARIAEDAARRKREAELVDDLLETKQALNRIAKPVARYVFAWLSLTRLARFGISIRSFLDPAAKSLANDAIAELNRAITFVSPTDREIGEQIVSVTFFQRDVFAVTERHRGDFLRLATDCQNLVRQLEEQSEANQLAKAGLYGAVWSPYTAAVGLGFVSAGAASIWYLLDEASSLTLLPASLLGMAVGLCIVTRVCIKGKLFSRLKFWYNLKYEERLVRRLKTAEDKYYRLQVDAREIVDFFISRAPGLNFARAPSFALQKQLEGVLLSARAEEGRLRRLHPEVNDIPFPVDGNPIKSARQRILSQWPQLSGNGLLA
ncbi:hypothetical protein [Bradyrhizobium sp. S69]|uniref:hypothetical protein n=1 Tax=Bradyrhizobium sp. S69 TaxID=1641856 RepID=UPI00131D8130|nr:hypothetical protein [Bradyrhizobium sp. S69]